MRTVHATRYVTPLREGGSMPGLVEADDDGLYVLKFRGAGQGAEGAASPRSSPASSRAPSGCRCPRSCSSSSTRSSARAEPDPEIQELIAASGGRNVGLDFLPGSLTYNPAAGAAPDPELAAEIVWLDALTTNVDRSPQNPNLLLWHGRLWLIDHGAALYLQHAWEDPPAERAAPVPGDPQPRAAAAARATSGRPTRGSRRGSTAHGGRRRPRARCPTTGSRRATRAEYAEYLCRRLEAPRGFAAEAEEARRAA